MKLRHVIIGVGAGVLGMHREALKLETVDVVGATDVNQLLGRQRADELQCPFFLDFEEMLGITKPDLAVIMAPHPFHAPLAISCLKAGVHVLVEKPMAVEIAEADEMIATAKVTGKLLAVNFQQRFRPEVQMAKQLIISGKLGRLQHVNMVVDWFRPKAYFASGSWRATWKGEGGGVLMNQACHNLDALCFLVGMPERVVAWTRTQLHDIEVEDTVQAMFEWGGGYLGSLHTSTAEAGRNECLEVVGTGGVMRVYQGSLTVNLFESPLEQFVIESKSLWDPPVQKPFEVHLPQAKAGHVEVYRHLHQAITQGAQLLISGQEARQSLELANAMIFSSFTKQAVEFPLDKQNYHDLLENLKAGKQ